MPQRKGRTAKQRLWLEYRRANENRDVSGNEVASKEEAVESWNMQEQTKGESTGGKRKGKGAMTNPPIKKCKTEDALAEEEAHWRVKYLVMQQGFRSVGFS